MSLKIAFTLILAKLCFIFCHVCISITILSGPSQDMHKYIQNRSETACKDVLAIADLYWIFSDIQIKALLLLFTVSWKICNSYVITTMSGQGTWAFWLSMSLQKPAEDARCVVAQAYNNLKVIFAFVSSYIIRLNKGTWKSMSIFIFTTFKNIIIALSDNSVWKLTKTYLKWSHFSRPGSRVIDVPGFPVLSPITEVNNSNGKLALVWNVTWRIYWVHSIKLLVTGFPIFFFLPKPARIWILSNKL